MLTSNRKTMPRVKLLSLLISLALAPAISPALAAVDISQKPLFLGRNAPPLNQLIIGRDHKLYYEAYNDASDLNGDGALDIRFNPRITYYGYFDSSLCYTHSGGGTNTGLFTPAGNAGPLNTCSGQWSGNWLNYITTSRIDALRKVLYGGYREVDDADKTILRRSYIPRDAHTWGKEYRGSAIEGYSISAYTPLAEPTTGTQHLFGNLSEGTTNPPLLRVVPNGSLRVVDWVYKQGGSILTNSAGAYTDYTVRVQVCTDTYHGEDCKKYPNGHWKPIGLLQEYGETDSMMFGLLTGSYDKNMWGGVLRKKMESITNEIDPTTGQILAPAGGAIISNLDKLRIYDWNGSAYRPGWTGAWLVNRAMNPGEFVDWGNPIAEIMYEGMRYFAGKTSATTAFSNSGGTVDSALGLTEVSTWDDPYDYTAKTDTTPQKGYPWCSRPFQLVISDINPSFDSDQVPGGYFGGTGDLSIGAQSQLSTISSGEGGFPSMHFIGQSGAQFDGAPTAKTVDSLGTIRGLAPEEPTKQGSYNAAAVAFYGNTNDISSTAANTQNVKSFQVALSSPLPKLDFNVNGKTISLVPFAKTAGGCPRTPVEASGTYGGFQPTNTITDIFIEEIYNTDTTNTNPAVNGGRPYYKFVINFEDVEQAADHDMDAIARYTIQDLGSSLQIDMEATEAVGCLQQHIGYVISGTTHDGVYLDIIDKDTATPGPSYFLDTPSGVNAGGCLPPAVCAGLLHTASRTFYPGSGNSATLLKDPLWYAAKWGGFTDTNSNNRPDQASEWDTDKSGVNDGVPNNYFLVQNPLNLKESLKNVFDGILSRSTSQTSVGASTTGSVNADSAIYVAGFDPARWNGKLQGIKFSYQGTACSTIDAASGCDWLSWEVVGSPAPMPAPASRNIKFWRANPPAPLITGEVDFKWATLTAAEKLLFADTANPTGNPAIVDYLRGVRDNEILPASPKDNNAPTATRYLRTRTSILGDIVNSDPVYVGKADAAQRKYERRSSISTANQTSFLTYVASSATRTKMVYVGANDGMLHGFNAKTGDETFAYMPAEVFARIKALSEPKIGDTGQPYLDHQYYVDGKIGVGDAFIGGAWKTILVGSTGAGGKTLFALDVTDPANIDVMWEFTHADLGQVRGKPQVILLDNGTWAAVVGNGYNSINGKANLVVVDLETGTLIKSLAGVIAAVEPSNGLAQVAGWDDGNDGDIDFFYGGDLLGRLWKFDLTGNDNTWSSQHMFTTTDNNGAIAKAQPITGGVNIALNPEDGLRYVFFGTGRYMGATDVTDMQLNALYGIQDTGSSVNFTDLKERKIINDWTAGGLIGLQRTLAIEAAVTGDMVGRKGWYVPLSSNIASRTAEGQRIYGTPLVYGKTLVTSVNIPVEDPCSPGGFSYNLAINPFTGSRLNFNFYDINTDGVLDDGDSNIFLPDGTTKIPTSGIYFDALSADPTAMGDRLLIGLSDGTYANIKTNSGLKKGRLSWREVLR